MYNTIREYFPKKSLCYKMEYNMKKIILFSLTLLLFALNAQSIQLPEGYTEIVRTSQPDGKILVVSQNFETPHSWQITRFNTDDTLDLSFGTRGSTGIISSFDDSYTPLDIQIQPDDKILVRYILKSKAKGTDQYLQTRINVNGTLDPFDSGLIMEPVTTYQKIL